MRNSRALTLGDFLKTLLHLYSWHAPVLRKGLIISHFNGILDSFFYSEDYWKLYENYTGALKKIAEVQDTLETAKKELSDAHTERKSALSKCPIS